MDEIIKIFGEEHYSNRQDQIRQFWQGERRYVISVSPVKHNFGNFSTWNVRKL